MVSDGDYSVTDSSGTLTIKFDLASTNKFAASKTYTVGIKFDGEDTPKTFSFKTPAVGIAYATLDATGFGGIDQSPMMSGTQLTADPKNGESLNLIVNSAYDLDFSGTTGLEATKFEDDASPTPNSLTYNASPSGTDTDCFVATKSSTSTQTIVVINLNATKDPGGYTKFSTDQT